jgi:hypothetical protein
MEILKIIKLVTYMYIQSLAVREWIFSAHGIFLTMFEKACPLNSDVASTYSLQYLEMRSSCVGPVAPTLS